MPAAHREDPHWEANVLQHFPPDLLEPWQARVAEELPAHWHAHMLPALGEGSVLWTLERKGEADAMHGPPRYRILFTGVDRDRLIDAAQNFVRGYI